MELLPSDVEARTFHVVRKGYDPDEVQAFLKKVGTQMSSLEERVKIALVKADRLERKLFDAQRSADPVAGAYDDALEIRRRVLAEAEAEAGRIRQEAATDVASPSGPAPAQEAPTAEATRAEAARAEAARLEAEARSLLDDARDRVEAMEAEAAALLADARARAERIVASAVATADRTREDHSHRRPPRGDGSALAEPTSMTVDLTGETPRIEVATPPEPLPTDTKPSRYMSRSAGLPRLGEDAGSVLQDMAKVRIRNADD